MDLLCQRVDELLLATATPGGESAFGESDSTSSYGASTSTSPPSSLASPTLSLSGSCSPLLLPLDSVLLDDGDIISTRLDLPSIPTTSAGPSRREKQQYAASLVKREAQALLDLADRLEREGEEHEEEASIAIRDGFSAALDAITSMHKYGKLVFTGVGKSGLLARKAVATFNSLGIQSSFLHPVEALHGDMGLVSPHGLDVVILVSYSGRTAELLSLVYLLRAKNCHSVISLTTPRSPLSLVSDITLDVTVQDHVEADPAVPAPTSSVQTALAMLDALALTLLRLSTGWDADMAERRKVFAENHPGGNLGLQLAVKV